MAHTKTSFATLALTILALSAGCTNKSEEASTKKELRVLSWSEYFDDAAVRSFEKKTGAKVKLDYFANNEELLAKIQASVKSGSKGYDLIVPSDYMVDTMKQLGLLKPIDKTKLSFLADFDPEFLKPSYDPALEHSIPFAWGTTGIAVNTQLAKGIDLKKVSWKDIFENKAFAGKATMLNDSKENLHAALLATGKHWANATEADIRSAFEYLKKTKKNLRIYTDETKPVIEADECALCQAFSGDVLSVGAEKAGVVYVIPVEGATIWSDNLAIPVNATEVELAHELMNHLLSAEGAKTFTESVYYPTPNLKAKALLDASFVNNPFVYPPKAAFEKLSFLDEKPELLPLIDRLWTELKSM
jgi:spermidine/putrescine transport system substrate-binding protein